MLSATTHTFGLNHKKLVAKTIENPYKLSMPFKNPEDRKRWWKERRDKIRETLEEAKSLPCADCGGKFHLAAMQFDHVRGKKKFNLAAATAQSSSLESLKAEIAKCDVVCANCHHVRTYERGYFNRHEVLDTH